MHRALATLLIFAPAAHIAAAAEPTYRLVRCVSVAEHGFAASFQSERKEQRRISFSSKGLSFGGNVKGQAKLEQVKELRLSPELEIVFSKPGLSSLRFGPLSPQCRDIIRREVGTVLRVVDGQG
jgi:hypothetical protein